jgi:hypothetical protein
MCGGGYTGRTYPGYYTIPWVIIIACKKAECLEVQGTQYVGASNEEETLTLGAKGMRTSSATASARVEDPEECTEAQGPEVQGTLEGSEAIVLSSTSIASTQ